MKVKSLELIQLKSYENSKLEFSESINLLIGANNSGKSTIIRALLNLQYVSFTLRDIRATFSAAKTFIEVSDFKQNDHLPFIDPQHPETYEILNTAKIFWGIYSIGLKEELLYYDSKYKTKRLDHNRIQVVNKNGEEMPLRPFHRFPDSENLNNFIYPFLAKRKTEYYDGNISHEQSFKVLEGLRNLAAKIQKIGNPSHPMNSEYNKRCDEILGFRVGVIPMMEQHGSGQEPGIYVNHTSMIPIRAMGDGVSNIVGFIVTLLTEDHKLYLIEELENDLHPRALKQLLILIKEKSQKNQFVISTHSHIVLNYLSILPKSKLFYVNWTTHDSENGNSIPTSKITEIENNPGERLSMLRSLGYDVQDFDLFESYLLLEESSAELIIREFLIPNIIPDLYNRIKTIGAKGVDDLKARAIDFNRLFVYIHTSPIYQGKAWVIADGDAAGIECIRSLRESFKSWPDESFSNFKKANFEEYYPKRFRNRVKKILALQHGKREEKLKLLKDVMSWALKNRDVAIKEFRVSASEVILKLEDILKKINSKR